MTTLDPDQIQAINSQYAQTVVAAGPGAGKTAVIVARIAARVAMGKKVAAVTLTNAAADEMRGRLDESSQPWHLGTIHSLAVKIIAGAGHPVTVLNEADAHDLEMEARRRVGFRGTDANFNKVFENFLAGDEGVHAPRETLIAVKSALAMQKELGAYSYDGLIYWAKEIYEAAKASGFVPAPMELIIDEAQDCAAMDWRLFRALTPFIFAVGDPDQSIYGFRGGSLARLIQFSNASKLIVLRNNYRSVPQVCEVANRIMAYNQKRIPKSTRAVRTDTGTVALHNFRNFIEEAAAVSVLYNDITATGWTCAILNRTNVMCAEFRKALGLQPPRSDKPADWARAMTLMAFLANPSCDWTAAKAVEAITGKSAMIVLRAALKARQTVFGANFDSLMDTGGALNWLARRRVSEESIHRIGAVIGEDGKITPEVILAADNTQFPDPGPVMTIHAAKGREFDAVILTSFDSENMDSADEEEARRLVYVAVTRARFNVYMTWADERPGYGGAMAIQVKPSRMIEELFDRRKALENE